jgi:hypothetical protein
VLIALVVVAVIGLMAYAITRQMSKPATESKPQRRETSNGSRRTAISTAAVVATKSGRTVVDSGRQVGRSLAELAKSSVAMPTGEAATRPPAPNGAGRTTPTAPGRAPRAPATGRAGAAAAAAPVAAAASTATPAATPLSSRIATLIPRPAPRPAATTEDQSEEYEFIVPSVPRRSQQRLYPRWWRRVFSFVALGLLTLAFGVAVGAAIGALIAFLNRAIQSTL